jgi:hypothetical protein
MPNNSTAPAVTRHVLQTTLGISCTMTLREADAQMACLWSKSPPFTPDEMRVIRAEYFPWRDALLKAWCRRTGNRLVIVTL